ncbi:hypothetical protein HDU84_005603 [Entophlyctis sp. JEL0112]|nr:hypothetical protein HDU84_005603 [Entophlyctis sp. JEL0112]
MVNFIMPIKSQSVIPEGLQKLFPQKNSQFFSASSAIADETTTLSNLGGSQKELVSSMKKQIADEGTKSLDSIVSYYSEETFSKATTANQEPVPMVPPAESEFNWPSQNRSQDDFVSEQKAASKTDHSSLLESLTQEPNDTSIADCPSYSLARTISSDTTTDIHDSWQKNTTEISRNVPIKPIEEALNLDERSSMKQTPAAVLNSQNFSPVIALPDHHSETPLLLADNSSPIENSTGKSEKAAKSVCKDLQNAFMNLLIDNSGSNTQSAPAPENSVNLKVPDSASSESNSKNTFSFMLNFDANASLHIHLAAKASPAQDENCNEISQQTTSLSKLGILVEEKTGKELRDLVENPVKGKLLPVLFAQLKHSAGQSDFVNNQRSQIVHPNVSKKCSTTVDLAIPFAGNNTRQIVQEDVYMANESKEISRNSPANKVHFRNLTAEINASHENIVSKPLISENNSSELLAASESKKKDLDTLTFMDKTSSPTSICDAETSKIHQKVHQSSPNLKMTIPDGTLRALLPDQKHAQTTEIETKTIEEMIETCKKNNVLMHERMHKVDQALAQVRGGLAELKSRPFAKKLKDRKYITSEILSRNHEQQEEIEFMKIHVAYLKFVAASFEYLIIEPAKLFSVGQNDDGQLGINNSEIHGGIPCTSFFKSVVFRTPVNIIKLACGGMHSLALTSTGKILSWGASEFLGRTTSGSDNCEPRYVEIGDPNVEFMDISCGECFSAAIDSFGKVWTWGSFRNTLGEEFHDVLTQRQHIPKQLFGISVRVVQIACGESHMVVLGEDGRVAGWGFNTHAQLGQPWKPDSRNIAHTQLPFVLPPGGFSARAVFAAGFSTFVAGSLNGSDTLLACGGNLFGELGVGDEKARYWLQEVVELRGKRVVKVAGGLHHTAALDSDGNVWVAGRGDSGQLGLGSSVEHVHTFTKLELNGAQATDLTCSVSGNQTYVVTKERKLMSMGFNCYGQLGLKHDDNVVWRPHIVPLKSRETLYVAAGSQFCVVGLTERKDQLVLQK